MTGELVFTPYGVVGAQDGQNLYLETTETFINTPLTCRNGLMVMGDVIETNDDYVAETDNDIVDVKSLVGNDSIEGLNLVINKPVMRSKMTDGGKLYRSDSNPDRIVYQTFCTTTRKSDAAKQALFDLKNNLTEPRPQSGI